MINKRFGKMNNFANQQNKERQNTRTKKLPSYFFLPSSLFPAKNGGKNNINRLSRKQLSQLIKRYKRTHKTVCITRFLFYKQHLYTYISNTRLLFKHSYEYSKQQDHLDENS